MARKHATFRQTVQADKRRKPLTEPFKNGSRVLVRGRPYTSSPRRSKKLEPRWFGPFKVREHSPDTDNYKLHLPPRMTRQKLYFHVSSLKDYRGNDRDRFKSRRMDKPAPILIDNAEEWEAEQILDYRRQNNRHEFLVHRKAMSEWTTPGNLSRTSTTPWNSYRNTVMLTTQQNQRPRSPPTTLKLPGNPCKSPLHPALQTIAQTTSGNPVTMRNMILAALSRTISLPMTTASYGTPTRALRTAKTLESLLIFQNQGM